jgi:hypothetical protein
LLLIAMLQAAAGCAVFRGTPQTVRTDAALGKVIIYRNGVAYFERQARFEGDKLTLTVPAERVDDFLKSLTVVDASSGTALPVSFPTVERGKDTVELKIQLPHAGSQNLRLSYVTESPAWKPTYRLVLGPDGRGNLQAWAVVDNVSGEDWERVTVGVGSTSALSFKYDLHSVRVVERETLVSDPMLALAPPTGGSPYQVGGKEVKVLGNVRLDEVEEVARFQNPQRVVVQNNMIQQDTKVEASKGAAGKHRAMIAPGSAPRTSGPPAEPNVSLGSLGGQAQAASNPAGQAALARLTSVLRGNNERIRIEGYAKPGDSNPNETSLSRANVVRDQLIANGIPAARLEAVGTGQVSQSDGVRLMVADNEAQKQAQVATPKSSGVGDTEPIGNAFFVAGTAMTIENGRSAMVALLNTDAEARQVYYFDPISARGSKRFAFKAVRLVNPSGYTLDAGPFTVYAQSQFLGEGLSDPVPPKSKAFIPFALDKEIIVDPGTSTREQIDKLVTIQRGIVTSEVRSIRQTKLAVTNRGSAPAELYVRHAVPAGWKLEAEQGKFEKLGEAYLFPVTVPAKGSVELSIEESTPVMKTIDIRTDPGVRAIELFLKTAKLDAALQSKLAEIVRMHSEIHDMQEKVGTLESQMRVFRTRIDEIHAQLVTLRNVPTAQQLSRHLAQKMEEISNRLQKATIEETDLKSQLMTKQIAIQDRLAELTLSPEKKGPVEPASKGDDRGVAPKKP